MSGVNSGLACGTGVPVGEINGVGVGVGAAAANNCPSCGAVCGVVCATAEVVPGNTGTDGMSESLVGTTATLAGLFGAIS